jgi:hypothetical protein
MARGTPSIAMQWANADSSDGGSGSSGDSGSDSDSGDADSDADDRPAVSGSGAAVSPSAAAAGRGRDSGRRPKHKRRKGAKALKQGQKRQLQRMEISDASDDSAAGDSGADSEPASDAGVALGRMTTPWMPLQSHQLSTAVTGHTAGLLSFAQAVHHCAPLAAQVTVPHTAARPAQTRSRVQLRPALHQMQVLPPHKIQAAGRQAAERRRR